ncbi:hypothetical protein IEQ34_016371 [Dendrobium chrysotoxum]|uniref:Protein kinase domain-containing protein n=1 Tax=Dendrobium chrysotoxum TaxID=161865 RepID=A0AAV7GF55_DENCH|nr:hypothetical protein IEQ34_016371 [Dendrobium chrysotoxum]
MIKTRDLGVDNVGHGLHNLVELIKNCNLKELRELGSRIFGMSLDQRKCLLIATDMTFQMEYLHDKNIINFNLKYDNLLVNLKNPR